MTAAVPLAIARAVPPLRLSADARRLFAILLVAIAARLLAFGNPILHVDEEYYFTVARAMVGGALPYVDIWDRKPIGLFLLYLPPAALGYPAGIWAYQLIALGFAVATAWMVDRIARAAGWTRGALIAALAYLLWLDLAEGAGGQAPVFYNLPIALAAWLVLRSTSEGPRLARDTAAMALVGIALQIKYACVVEGAFFGCWLVWLRWREGQGAARIAGAALVLAATAWLPTLAAYAVYAARGHGDAWAYANLRSIFGRGASPLGESLGNLATLVVLLAPVVAMALAGRGAHEGGQPLARRFVHLWLAAALLGVVVAGGWFDHYALPALVPGMAAAAGWFGMPRWRARIVPAVLIAVALAGQIKLLVQRTERGTPTQFARLVAAVGSGPGCLHVYSGDTILYPATGRCALTPWRFPSHLSRAREAGAVGVDQAAELRRVLARGPAVIVARATPYPGERPEIRALLEAALARTYRQSAAIRLGNQTMLVYRRSGLGSAAQPAYGAPR